MGEEEKRWEKTKEMRWSEEGKRRGNKLGFSAWSKLAWNQQPGCTGSHTCHTSGHWVVLFSLGETPLPAAPVPSVRCDADEAAEFTFRSGRSSRRFSPETFGVSAAGPPSCRWRQTGATRCQVLILIHLRCSQSHVTQSSPVAVGPPLLAQRTTKRLVIKSVVEKTKFINVFNQLLKNR